MDIGVRNRKWAIGVSILPDFILLGAVTGKAYVNDDEVTELMIGIVFVTLFVRRYEKTH